MTAYEINIVTHIIFYCFAIMAVCSATLVVFSRSPVYSILFLVLTFFATAGIWIILQAEFLGLILVIIYVGAVMTLFLFVVMMLDLEEVLKHRSLVRFYPIVMILVGLIFAGLLIFVGPWHFGFKQFPAPTALPAGYSSTKALGGVLYTHYMLPFELAGVILLVGMVSAIALTQRAKRNRRRQTPSGQIAVQPEDRIRLVKDKDIPRGGDSA
ncbi:MAG: NADH:ubiquinone oxidoreductase subunit J [Legionellaceae bacterium]|nr:NADH:ubiquinone oxidoreductase subunit J [Legionellaceae bacterium]|tara:strand:- start:290 stop:925 length:636 start_codon:yes stop_codon:yes gene_type:complete